MGRMALIVPPEIWAATAGAEWSCAFTGGELVGNWGRRGTGKVGKEGEQESGRGLGRDMGRREMGSGERGGGRMERGRGDR